MKLEELQIGDWVKITEPDDFHGYIAQVVIINSITRYITVNIPNMHDHDVLVDDLEPIPLTYEILENNFGATEHKLNIQQKYLVYPKNIMVGAQLKPSPDCRKQLEVFNYNIKRGIKYECNQPDDVMPPFYVHELQHILKDCKINSEIIL